MTRFEIRGRHGALSVREDAADELGAVEQALEQGLVADGDVVTVEPADELPVGWYGEDPEAG